MKTSVTSTLFKGCIFLMALAETYIEPANNNSHLFRITRNKDANEIFYAVNISKDGKLNRTNPIDIFWQRKKSGNKKEPLTLIEQKYAYGLKFQKVNDYEASFRFVSMPAKNLTLKKDKHGKYCVFSTYGGKTVEVSHIYLHIVGGSFWFPKISRVEIHGKGSLGEKITETIKP